MLLYILCVIYLFGSVYCGSGCSSNEQYPSDHPAKLQGWQYTGASASSYAFADSMGSSSVATANAYSNNYPVFPRRPIGRPPPKQRPPQMERPPLMPRPPMPRPPIPDPTIPPPSDCNWRCNVNATYVPCPDPCPPTCRNPKGVPFCYETCLEFGCQCNAGFVLSDEEKCILYEDCPEVNLCDDCNADYVECPDPCPKTCDMPGGSGVCCKTCPLYGCECKEGFFLNDDGKCVELQDCPGAKLCSVNETFKFCNSECPNNKCPVDDSLGIIACSQPFPCASGCGCKENYYRLNDEDERCVLPQDCPRFPCTRPNEMYLEYPPACLFERCTDIGQPMTCDNPYSLRRPRCVCAPGYFRNGSDICVLERECAPTKCSYNETQVECKTVCPPESCDISYTEYFCPNTTECIAGCDCLPNYLRNSSGICIFNEDCPPPATLPICELNEVPTSCKITCPPLTCDSIFTSYNCENFTSCEPGCDCDDGYLRNSCGDCVLSDDCFSECQQCDVSKECRPTCENPIPKDCPVVDTPEENQDGCKCKDGFILTSPEGTCIEIEQCPTDVGCNGDPNAVVTKCPWSCPSTCDDPQASSCGKTCKKVGCQCKSGYLLSEIGGICILPDECHCGNPCGQNATFSDCSYKCPNQVCPKDDSLTEVACRPGFPCPPGCMCNQYYRRLSDESNACVLARDCPPPSCTRPNEKYNPCASECLNEYCIAIGVANDCVPDPLACKPKCVCCEHHYRETTGQCVPEDQCPKECNVPQHCRPTCAVPNPPDCPFIPSGPTNDDCNCAHGYILDVPGGTCIEIKDCPQNLGCNGDPHAVVKEDPQPCPSTCDSPNATPCKKKVEERGCVCKPGYLLSAEGLCILPDQCIGGDPCGPNGTFVPCVYDCGSNFCPTDDSREPIMCQTSPDTPCLSGCACKINHRILSLEHRFCIVSMECPVINCTRQFEHYDSCPSDCRYVYCKDADKEPVQCNTLLLNCNPQCVCDDGFFRNHEDKCISAQQCLKLNKRNT